MILLTIMGGFIVRTKVKVTRREIREYWNDFIL